MSSSETCGGVNREKEKQNLNPARPLFIPGNYSDPITLNLFPEGEGTAEPQASSLFLSAAIDCIHGSESIPFQRRMPPLVRSNDGLPGGERIKCSTSKADDCWQPGNSEFEVARKTFAGLVNGSLPWQQRSAAGRLEYHTITIRVGIFGTPVNGYDIMSIRSAIFGLNAEFSSD